MSKSVEKSVRDIDCRLSRLEQEYRDYWAHRTGPEYEKKLQTRILTLVISRVWKLIGSVVLLFGFALYTYVVAIMNSKVDEISDEKYTKLSTRLTERNDLLVKYNEILKKEITKKVSGFEGRLDEFKKNDEKRIRKIFEHFNWEQVHGFGYVYRSMAELVSKDETIDKDKKKWLVTAMLGIAESELKKATRKEGVQGSTFWELGCLSYKIPLKCGLPAYPNKAIGYYKRAIELYSEVEIMKGWRGGAYEDLADAQLAYANGMASHTAQSIKYRKNAIKNKKLALNDYRKYVSSEKNSWVAESIENLMEEIEELEKKQKRN